MPEYSGTEFQIAVQKRMRARADWIRSRPDIANGGRLMNFLDPETTGWDRIREFLAEDGVVAITAMNRDGALDLLRGLFPEGYDFGAYDIYLGEAADILAACRAILAAQPLPAGWRAAVLDNPDDEELEAIQALNAATGVAPHPAFYARSEAVPSFTSCIWDETGRLVATASVTARYHPASRLAGHVFKGSTSVDPAFRGRSLGKVANAHVLIDSHAALGWTHGLSQVAADNPASQKTISACGFRPAPELVTYGILNKGVVFTR